MQFGPRGLLLASSALIASVLPAMGQDATWLATPADGNYNSGANWDAASVPTGTAFFDTSSVTALTTTGGTVGGWTFNAGASDYTVANSGTFNFTGAGIVINGGSVGITNFGTLNFSGNSNAGDAAIDNGTSGVVDFSTTTGAIGDSRVTAGSIAGGGTFELGANELTVGGNNTSTTVTGVISGSGGSLVKTGTGTMTLSGVNTYTGQTTLQQGTLSLQNDAALGTGNLVTQGGTTINYGDGITITNLVILDGTTQFNVGAGATATQSNQILETTSQSLEKTGAGTLIVQSANNTGTTTISAGTWQGGYINAFSASSAHTVAAGATLDMGGWSQTVSSLSGAGTVTSSVAGDVTFFVGNFATGDIGTEFSGTIQNGAGTVGLTVDGLAGTGPFILSGTNTYTGDTLICSCSSLQIGNGGTTGSITSNVINNNLLIFNRSDTYQFDNTISDGFSAGRVEQAGAGTLILNGINSYSGGTTISNGAVQVMNNSSVGTSTVTLDGGAFIAGTTGLNFTNAFAVNSTGGTIDTNANTLTLSGGINDGSSPGEINVQGQGTLALSGTGNFTGQVTVSDSTTLRFESSNAIGTGIVQVQGSTIDYANGVNIANSITLGSTLTAFNVSSGTATQTGVIEDLSSAAVFEKTGAGTLVVTNLGVEGATVVTAGTLTAGGTNAFSPTSAMTVSSAGTLNIGGFNQTIASLAGAGTVTNNGGSAATLRLNTAGIETFAGSIVDGASALALTMNGSGTTILSGVNTYTGATIVNDGTLQVDGSITSVTTVNSGATLSGSGSVFDTTINSGGTLMPGNGTTPGTLTVTGNLTFNGGSTYVVFMTPTLNSLTTVSGTATLSGTVNVTATPGVYNAGQYNIVTATGGFNGTTFTDFTTTGFGSDAPTLVYDSDDVFLLFNQKTIVLLPSFNGNQGAVATGINNAMLGGATLPASFTTLLGYGNPQLANGLSQLAGQGATGGATGGIGMMNAFLSLLLNPLGGAPGGNPGALGFARSFGPGEQMSAQAKEAYAAVTPRDRRATAPSLDQRWSLWGQGYGGYNATDGDAAAGTSDLIARTWGLAAGADYRVSPNTTLGFALAGGTMSWGLSGNLGGGSSDTFQVGAYGSHAFGAAYVSAALSYAWHDMTTDRTVTAVGTEKMTASFQGQNFGGRLETGYRFDTPSFGVTPYAAAQVQRFDTPAYSETTVAGTGAFALNYDARSVTATRFELGAWFDKVYALDRGQALAVRTRAAWAHDHSDDKGMSAVFQSLPGSTFIVNGAAIPDNLLLLSAGAELRMANNWSFGAKFDGEFASNAQTYSGTASVRYAW